MTTIDAIIDALQDAKADENGMIMITDKARNVIVRTLMKYSAKDGEQDAL